MSPCFPLSINELRAILKAFLSAMCAKLFAILIPPFYYYISIHFYENYSYIQK